MKKRVLFVSREGDKNKFYKTVEVNKHFKATCFVDFGSECSMITESFARQNKLKIAELLKPVVLTVFGGSEVDVHGKIS